MAVYFPVRICMKNVTSFSGSSYRNMNNNICDVSFGGSAHMHSFRIGVGKANYDTTLASSSNSFTSSVRLRTSHRSCLGSINAKQINGHHSLQLNWIRDSRFSLKTCSDISFHSHDVKLRLLMPNNGNMTKSKYSIHPGSRRQCYGLVSLLIGSLVCCSYSEPSYAEASDAKNIKEDNCGSSPACFSHGKKVYTDYSVIGIPGDGRCLFRSVAHGACLRSGKPIPDENLQRKLADELRDKVADEFIKRREETEWFIEGDFDKYVRHIRKPHVWGGEPELLMASHVLQMPITVYMDDQESGGLISIAEYGQEYGKDNPIEVLYHGSGHYDALQIQRQKSARSRL
ncbi:hypothetical protein Leryth_018454 [Lithospermum erythrorhizon]|nr:hypothetical protein Leryth_018454 [Lithospermum erythrorhizon]